MFESSESENEDEDEIIGKVRTVYNTEQASNHYTDQTILSKLESRVKRIKYDNSEIIKKNTNIHDNLQILRTKRSRTNSRENTIMLRSPSSSPRKQCCFICDQGGHFAREYLIIKSSSSPFQSNNRSLSPQTKPLNFKRLEM